MTEPACQTSRLTDAEYRTQRKTGVFENTAEVVRVALREFISRRRFELMERQQLDDVAWALREKSGGK